MTWIKNLLGFYSKLLNHHREQMWELIFHESVYE